MRERPANPDAADLAMRGVAAFNRGFTPENLNKAIEYFDRGVAAGSGEPAGADGKGGSADGRPHVSRARQGPLASRFWTTPRRQSIGCSPRSPNNAHAHLTKGLVAKVRASIRRLAGGIERAIAIDRNLAPAYAEKGHYMITQGRSPEAFELDRAGVAARSARRRAEHLGMVHVQRARASGPMGTSDRMVPEVSRHEPCALLALFRACRRVRLARTPDRRRLRWANSSSASPTRRCSFIGPCRISRTRRSQREGPHHRRVAQGRVAVASTLRRAASLDPGEIEEDDLYAVRPAALRGAGRPLDFAGRLRRADGAGAGGEPRADRRPGEAVVPSSSCSRRLPRTATLELG